MPKPSKPKAAMQYVVFKCKTDTAPIALGILGFVKLVSNDSVLFFLDGKPSDVEGLDIIETKMAAAVPEAVHKDVREFVARRCAPEKLLAEVARRYSGTIYAEAGSSACAEIKYAVTDGPEKIMPQLAKEIMKLARSEKLSGSMPEKWRTKKGGPRRDKKTHEARGSAHLPDLNMSAYLPV
jgi:hypothetical protein